MPFHTGFRQSYEKQKMLLWVERGDNMLCKLSGTNNEFKLQLTGCIHSGPPVLHRTLSPEL